MNMKGDYDAKNHLYPYCVVWTPIPFITWLVPFIGHMGIATSRGIIRDFSGSYFVSENNMGFGWPTMYWQLSPTKVVGGPEVFDRAIRDASDEYKNHMHNLLCDNCHSHVAYAMNRMSYNGQTNYNMVKLCFMMMYHGKYVNAMGIVKQWLPFALLALAIFGIILFAHLS
uniref:Transmembrane protein 222 n=1 Tax=Steinernema glaseri TaxID=37863 RepID=A0A1I7Z7U1_9BILA